MTYFGPALDPPLGGSGRKTTTLVRDHEYFIPTKFHQNPSSGSGEEVENVKSLRTDGRTDDGRCAMTIAHSSLRLRWAKKKWSDFRPFFNTHVRNISYFYLCVRQQHRICSIVSKFRQFVNQHIENTGPCVAKTVTFGFFLSWLFYSKKSDNLFNSMIFNELYLEK